jgi:beta-lactamase superfamily II metal-dependent hydrolase
VFFTLEVLPAKEGDCLLLHWGSKTAPKLAVIDGGPGRVWEDSLRDRLEELRQARGLQTLDLDLVMVSHVDNDHIVGVKKLFAEVESGNVALRPRRLWHNTFNDVLKDSTDAYYATLAGSAPANIEKQVEKQLQKKRVKDAAEVAREIASVLAGHGEGRALRNSYAAVRAANPAAMAKLNSPFTGLITDAGGKQTLSGLSVQVLGPSSAQIDKLQKAFDKYIRDNGLVTASVLAAYADESVTNLSSIVCLVKVGTKSMLLTGDARGDFVLAALKKAGLYTATQPLKVDVFKVPHHGSVRNADPDLFEHIRAKTYVFSGDGKHGNPDRATLEMVFDSRPAADVYDVVLTYSVAATDKLRKHEHEKKGKTWDAKKHSIASLVQARQNAGFKFRLVEGAPVKVELADAVPW